VQGQPAARGRGSGGDVDELATDRGGGRSGQVGSAERAGDAGEVERDHREHQPGGVGVELARGQVRRRGGLEVGVDLLDDRVATMDLSAVTVSATSRAVVVKNA
jgi:hypothetical protein